MTAKRKTSQNQTNKIERKDKKKKEMTGGKRTKRSKAWLHYRAKDDGAICNHCQTFVAAKGGTTSNLFRHLLVGHGMDLNPCTIFKKMDSTQPRLFAATATPPPPTGPGLPGKAAVPTVATAVVVPSLTPRLPTLP